MDWVVGCREADNMRHLLGILVVVAIGWTQIAAAQEITADQINALREGCNKGDLAACRDLGTLFAVGNGVGREPLRALTLFRTACEGGDGKGCYGQGLLTQAGQGIAADPKAANALFEKACSGGDPRGCVALGQQHE